MSEETKTDPAVETRLHELVDVCATLHEKIDDLNQSLNGVRKSKWKAEQEIMRVMDELGLSSLVVGNTVLIKRYRKGRLPTEHYVDFVNAHIIK